MSLSLKIRDATTRKPIPPSAVPALIRTFLTAQKAIAVAKVRAGNNLGGDDDDVDGEDDSADDIGGGDGEEEGGLVYEEIEYSVLLSLRTMVDVMEGKVGSSKSKSGSWSGGGSLSDLIFNSSKGDDAVGDVIKEGEDAVEEEEEKEKERESEEGGGKRKGIDEKDGGVKSAKKSKKEKKLKKSKD